MRWSQTDSQIVQDGIHNQHRYILAFRYRTEGLHRIVRLAMLTFPQKKLHGYLKTSQDLPLSYFSALEETPPQKEFNTTVLPFPRPPYHHRSSLTYKNVQRYPTPSLPHPLRVATTTSKKTHQKARASLASPRSCKLGRQVTS